MAGPTPVRLRLSRAKGFDLQALSRATNGLRAVVVARPTPWGNPFVVGKDGKAEDCVRLYRMMLAGYLCLTCTPEIDAQRAAVTHVRRRARRDLRGKNLACWCRDGQPCHADVLLEIANG